MKGKTMKVKTTDIERTPSGFDRLPCDGRHDTAFHFYMYYTKREIVASWRDAHPATPTSEGEQ